MLQRLEKADCPASYLQRFQPDMPVHFFAPAALDRRLGDFVNGFAGDVTYAVKANPSDRVVARLWGRGLAGFDVASPTEIESVQRLCGSAVPMHYNNPVRSSAEIAAARRAGVRSWSVDDAGELRKMAAAGLEPYNEVSVRFCLDVEGGHYNFGDKFGATPDQAVALLRCVSEAGWRPALTFHVGTQCQRPGAYARYIAAAADIAQRADVRISRLNVGGGFPSGRQGAAPEYGRFFAAIKEAVDAAFADRPALLCEPGRALVADSYAYAVRIKSLRAGRVYLNDGIYGGLSEFPSMHMPTFEVISRDGKARTGESVARVAFGPTCDSIDKLPEALELPSDTREDDWLLFRSMGAYLTGVTTRFNGYGRCETVTVATL